MEIEDIEVPDGYLLDVEEIEGVTRADMEELEVLVSDFAKQLEQLEAELDAKLTEINDSAVYEALGIELHVGNEFVFSFEDRNED